MDDDDYKSIVKGRLQEDDFIEDDDGSGYIDNGMDDWDREDHSKEDKECTLHSASCAIVISHFYAAANSKDVKKSKPTASKSMKAPKKPRPDAPVARADNPYLLATPVGEEDDFMASLLGGLDESTSIQPSTSFANPAKPNVYAIGRKRKIQEQLSALEAERASKGFRTNGTPVASTSTATHPEELMDGYTDQRRGGERVKQEDEDMGGMEDSDFNFDYSDTNGGDVTMTMEAKPDDDDEVFVKLALPSTSKPKAAPVKRQLVNASAVKPTPPKVEPVVVKAPVTPFPVLPRIGANPAKAKGMDWRTATASLAIAPIATMDDVDPDAIDSTEADAFKAPFAPKNAKRAPVPIAVTKHANALESDGSLRFWWYDMLDMNGIVYLVGKVQRKDGKKGWVSAMVMVGGIERKLYLLPREKMLDRESSP